MAITQAQKDIHELNKTKGRLDSVGCGMCVAKWMQVTIHLQNGHTHSCHHPRTHKIPLEEIKKNPSALHNTWYKKHARKEMLTDQRPSECDYCWNVEDNSDVFSDRILKSNEPWAKPFWNKIQHKKDGKNYLLDWRENVNPTYVEVVFSSACNFKCSYCAPHISTQWMQEVKKHGGYPTTTKFNSLGGLKEMDLLPIPKDEPNPYVEAFWKWWPDLYQDLHTFRITGGEPLLARDTFKVLDYIIEHPNPNRNLSLAINSNLGGPKQLIDKFLEKMKRIEDEGRVREFIIFTSVDGWGEQAEYPRHGLDFNYFWDNTHKVLSTLQRCNLTFMSTYNALSVPSYKKLIEGVYQLKEEYSSPDRYWNSATFLDSSYLRYPQHQTVQVLPMDWSKEILQQAQLLDFYALPVFEHMYTGYSDIEIQKVKRIYDWMISRNMSELRDDEALKRNRHDFGVFFKEHDRRRGTDFCKVFPEFADFYHKCLEIKL